MTPMLNTNTQPPQNNSPHEDDGDNDLLHSNLAEIIEDFDNCKKRAKEGMIALNGGVPEPDPENDLPVKLKKYRAACHEVDVEELLPTAIRDIEHDWILNADINDVIKKYPSGEPMCLALVPVVENGLPTVALRLLRVSYLGWTKDLTDKPAYYFLKFPKEKQEVCRIQVPFYDGNVITKKKDIETLEERQKKARKALAGELVKAFNAVKALLDKK